MSPICSPTPIAQDGRNQQIRYVRVAQIRLLYKNANTGIVVTVIAAPILAYFYSDGSVMSNFREYGFDDVIPKPWRTAEVSEVFRRVLGQNANRKPDKPASSS